MEIIKSKYGNKLKAIRVKPSGFSSGENGKDVI